MKLCNFRRYVCKFSLILYCSWFGLVVLDLDATTDTIDPLMRFHFALFLLLASFHATLSQDIEHGSLLVDGAQTKAQTGDNFICATIDWWPHDKCDYNHCPWGYSSVVNLVSILKFIGIEIRKWNEPSWEFMLLFHTQFPYLEPWKAIKYFYSLLTLMWIIFQDLSHPFLAKAIQGVYMHYFYVI